MRICAKPCRCIPPEVPGRRWSLTWADSGVAAISGDGRRSTADDLWGFFDALAFNWLIAGSDAHAKNYSLLLAGTQSRLAPLYDVASFLPYDKSKGHKISLAMKIGGDYRLRRTDRPGAWDKTADEMGLDRDTAITRILNLAANSPPPSTKPPTTTPSKPFPPTSPDALSIKSPPESNTASSS